MLWLLLSDKGGTALGEYKQMSSRHLSYKAQMDFFFLFQRMLFLLILGLI